LGSMGSFMLSLMSPPPPQQQRYSGFQLRNACLLDRYEELQTMLQQHGLDLNLARPDTGQRTKAYARSYAGIGTR
jgi:hypothetical protein